MPDPNRFQAHAERCQKIAETCVDPLDKKAWQKLAADWLMVADLFASPEHQTDKNTGSEGERKARAVQ
jgi:hypothetical protein